MSTVNIFQVSIEIWGCLICVILTMITGESVYREGGAITRIWFMLLANGLLLASDAFAYIFRGDVSTMGMYMTRISNFMVFALEGIMTWNVAACVECLIQDRGKKVIENPWMRLCAILIIIQLIGVVITPFTGFYYHFDSTNHYQRAGGVFVSFLALGIVCVISAIRLIIYRSKVPTTILHTFKISVPVFMACFVVQLLVYGTSLLNIGLTILLLMLYLVLWNESNQKKSEKLMNEMEILIQELMDERKKHE